MPPRGTKAAHSSSARDATAARGAPDSLNSFLAGFVSGPHHEGDIVVNLKLLNKSSDTTKQKALTALIRKAEEASEDTLVTFVPNIIESVIRHAQDGNPLIRAAVFTLLRTVMSRGKAVKKAMFYDLPALSGVWVMAMNDMEVSVQQEAKGAFEEVFSPAKRSEMLMRYAENILPTLFESIEEVVAAGVPLRDEAMDRRANILFAAIRSLGFMVKQVSAAQGRILDFVLDNPVFMKVLPVRGGERGYLAAQAPLVRSSTLGMLRDVVSVCPLTAKISQMISRALSGSVRDPDVTITTRVWEVLLLWCRVNTADAISNFAPGFLDDVIDSFMENGSVERAEVVFPCLFPLLSQLSKDKRCGDVLDEFCGALVEKLHIMSETPNISAHELAVVLSSLLECWELHCVRKKSTEAASDCEELFTVITYNLVLLLESSAKRQRYLPVVVKVLTRGLLKVSLRSTAVFRCCMATLCALPGAAFHVLPDDPPAGVLRSHHHLRAAVCSALYATASHERAYARQLPMYEQCLGDLLNAQLQVGDYHGIKVLLCSSETRLRPSADAAHRITQALIDSMLAPQPAAELEAADEATSPVDDTTDPLRDLLPVALSWEHADNTDALLKASEGTAHDAVREAVKQFHLADPAKMFGVLLVACETSDFEDIRRCLEKIQQDNVTLTQEERTCVLRAIVSALEDNLRLVGAVDVPQDSEDAEESGSTQSDSSDEASSDVSSDESVDGTSGNADSEKSSEDTRDDGVLDERNEGQEVLLRVAEWCELLRCDAPLARLAHLNQEGFISQCMQPLTRLVVAVAPRVYPEQYMSIRALRAALQTVADDDILVEGMEAKVHFLKAEAFRALLTAMTELFHSYDVPASRCDDLSRRFWRLLVEEEVPHCFQAVHQLQQVMPFASKASLSALVTSRAAWDNFVVARRPFASEADRRSAMSLFDGFFSLAELQLTPYACVRTAQLVRLVDFADTTVTVPDGFGPLLFFLLLRAAAVKEVFSDSVQHALFTRLLPQAAAHVHTPQAAIELAKLICCEEDTDYLICTLGAVLRELAAATEASQRMTFILRARRIVSAVTSHAVSALFSSTGAKGISPVTASIYTTFFTLMDQTATVAQENILSQLAPQQEALFIEASCTLPQWDVTTAKLTLVIHRHLSSMPVVADSTVTSLIQYAQRQSPLDCMELLGELACTRILNLSSFSNLVHATIHALCRCCTLRHLPTNGRLTQQSARSSSTGQSFEQLRRVVLAAVLARRGVVVHNRADDVLRSTVNLVVFDSVCEAISRLQSTTGSDGPLLAKLIASTSDFMGSLLTRDVAVLRASEASVLKIAAVTSYAYLWLNKASIAKLEAIGMETVAGVMRSVCLLANLTLMRSSTSLHHSLRPVIDRLSLKPVREEFSSSNTAKVQLFRRQNALIAKTHKQKMVLFPYLLVWCVYLTTPDSPAEAAAATTAVSNKEWRAEVYRVLDLICALLLTPSFPKAKRLEETIIGAAMQLGEGGATPPPPPSDGLGFEVVALTRTDSPVPMEQLARGAAAAFALLLRGNVLPLTKSWLETLERKLQALFYSFVEQHISPLLIQESLLTVMSHSPDGQNSFSITDSYTVHVSVPQRSIELTYEMEDSKAAVRIAFPAAFPLRQPAVEYTSGKECGVSTEKWRAWMMRMTVMLFGGSANIWECIELFGRNLDAHFNGQEPCPICFAVVGAINHKLPDMRCSVCHNSAFHSSCLYTWWANGGQNICPLCRSPWVSE